MPRQPLCLGAVAVTLACLPYTAGSRIDASDERRSSAAEMTKTVDEIDELITKGRNPDDVIPAAVNRMADEIGGGHRPKLWAAAMAKKYPDDFLKIKWVFKPREINRKGGLGVGKPGQYRPDGIEIFMIVQANPRTKALSEEELKGMAPDLIRIADITLAMAEITAEYAPLNGIGMMTPAEWHAANDNMKNGAQQLNDAVKAGNSAAVKKAFATLYNSCNRCHVVFRN